MLRSLEGATSSGNLPREARYCAAVDSSILPDWDCPRVPITQSARAAASQSPVPKSMFDAEGGECSLDQALLDTIMATRPTWRSPSSENFSLLPLHFQCLLTHQATNFELLGHVWKSLFMQPGTVVVKQTSKGTWINGGVVLHATHVGALIWKLEGETVNGNQYWTLTFAAGAQHWQFVTVTNDLEQWYVARVRAISPHGATKLSPGLASGPPALRMVKLGPKIPLLQHAAESAFAGVTVAYLRKLWTDLELRQHGAGAKPTNEEGLLRGLLKHILGPKVDCEPIVQQRLQPKIEELPTYFDEENLDAARDAFDDQDFADMAREMQESRKRRGGGKASVAQQHASAASSCAVAPGASSHAKAASTSAGGLVGLKPPPQFLGQECWDSQQMKALAPPGTTLRSRETQWHRRWRGRYQAEAPNTISRCWGGAITEQAVQLVVIKFLWAVHARETQESCPWEF